MSIINKIIKESDEFDQEFEEQEPEEQETPQVPTGKKVIIQTVKMPFVQNGKSIKFELKGGKYTFYDMGASQDPLCLAFDDAIKQCIKSSTSGQYNFLLFKDVIQYFEGKSKLYPTESTIVFCLQRNINGGLPAVLKKVKLS